MPECHPHLCEQLQRFLDVNPHLLLVAGEGGGQCAGTEREGARGAVVEVSRRLAGLISLVKGPGHIAAPQASPYKVEVRERGLAFAAEFQRLRSHVVEAGGGVTSSPGP